MIVAEHIGTSAAEHIALTRRALAALRDVPGEHERAMLVFLEGMEVEPAAARHILDVLLDERGILDAPDQEPSYSAGFLDGVALGVRAARLESFA